MKIFDLWQDNLNHLARTLFNTKHNIRNNKTGIQS